MKRIAYEKNRNRKYIFNIHNHKCHLENEIVINMQLKSPPQ